MRAMIRSGSPCYFEGRRFTHKQLYERMCRAANGLLERGLVPGERWQS